MVAMGWRRNVDIIKMIVKNAKEGKESDVDGEEVEEDTVEW